MRITVPGTALATAALLSACAQPVVPTVRVMPGRSKSYEAFQADQQICSASADATVQPLMDRNNAMQVGTALAGVALGAALGGAIGGGRGAGIGAAAGALGGSGVGTNRADAATNRIQRYYDNTYASCMVAHGDVVENPAVLVQPAPVLVQPAPYLVQPAPYVMQGAPYLAAAPQ